MPMRDEDVRASRPEGAPPPLVRPSRLRPGDVAAWYAPGGTLGPRWLVERVAKAGKRLRVFARAAGVSEARAQTVVLDVGDADRVALLAWAVDVERDAPSAPDAQQGR